MSHSAAVHAEIQEREIRRTILREDLRERKAEHMIAMLRWAPRTASNAAPPFRLHSPRSLC